MNTLRNFICWFVSSPFGIVICSALLLLCFALIFASPIVAFKYLISTEHSTGYKIWVLVMEAVLFVIAIASSAQLSSRLQSIPGIWQIWQVIIKWTVPLIALYLLVFLVQVAIIWIENNSGWKIIRILSEDFSVNLYWVLLAISVASVMLYTVVALACIIYIKYFISDEDKSNPTAMRQILKYKLMTLVCGTTGAIFAISTPYIAALLDNSDEKIMSPVTNPLGAAVVLVGVIGILLFTPHNKNFGFNLFSREGASSAARSLFFWGMALPAFFISLIQGNHIYETKPENAAQVKVIDGGNNNEESYLEFNLQEGSPPGFFRTAFADEETDNDLNSLLNKGDASSKAQDFFFSADYGAKKYVISIRKFGDSQRAIRFRKECLIGGYNIENSQVIQLIANRDYRVIFPTFNKKLAKGDADHKLSLIEEHLTEDSDCAGIDPTLLEFE